jgi:hypothetical protein
MTVSTIKCVICSQRHGAAARSADLPQTTSAAAEAASSAGITMKQLVATGVRLWRDASKKEAWRPDMVGPAPAKAWASFEVTAARGLPRARATLGKGKHSEVIAAANRVVAACHDALVAAGTKRQQIIDAVTDGSFHRLMKGRFDDALAAVQAEAGGAAA